MHHFLNISSMVMQRWWWYKSRFLTNDSITLTFLFVAVDIYFISTFAFLSSPTKACLAAAVVFVLEDQTSWITAPHSVVYLAVVIFFVYFKLSSLFLHMNDPFQPLENLFCAVRLSQLVPCTMTVDASTFMVYKWWSISIRCVFWFLQFCAVG